MVKVYLPWRRCRSEIATLHVPFELHMTGAVVAVVCRVQMADGCSAAVWYHGKQQRETKSSLARECVDALDTPHQGLYTAIREHAMVFPLSPETIDLIGTAAACLTTFAFLPQVVKVWRTKSVRDISLYTYCAFALGILLWFVYGLGIGSYPVIVANGITFVLAVSILIMKICYSR